MGQDACNDFSSPWAHLLGTHDVRISIREHSVQVARDSAIDEKIDRKDAEMRHTNGEAINFGTFPKGGHGRGRG